MRSAGFMTFGAGAMAEAAAATAFDGAGVAAGAAGAAGAARAAGAAVIGGTEVAGAASAAGSGRPVATATILPGTGRWKWVLPLEVTAVAGLPKVVSECREEVDPPFRKK